MIKSFLPILTEQRRKVGFVSSIVVVVFIVLPFVNRLTTVEVVRVIDGDTFDAFPVGRVRLADIDAPELGQIGYTEAKTALDSMIAHKRVYLNVDDVFRKDPFNRTVCVVYVRQNAGLTNVNKALLDSRVVTPRDHLNEFVPFTWMLRWPIPWLPETYFFETGIFLFLITLTYRIFGKQRPR